MKTLLTLFVLLFSSSVVAGEDLTGKKLFCKKYTKENTLILKGFEFISPEIVHYHSHSNIQTKYYLSPRPYNTSASMIIIMSGTSDDFKNQEDFVIDRRSLVIERITSNIIFAEGECRVTSKNLTALINRNLELEKSKNIL